MQTPEERTTEMIRTAAQSAACAAQEYFAKGDDEAGLAFWQMALHWTAAVRTREAMEEKHDT